MFVVVFVCFLCVCCCFFRFWFVCFAKCQVLFYLQAYGRTCVVVLNIGTLLYCLAQFVNPSSRFFLLSFFPLQLFRKYLIFCGIGITNAQLFEMSVNEFKRNQVSVPSQTLVSIGVMCTVCVCSDWNTTRLEEL